MKYDYLVVGAGLYGAVFAQKAKEQRARQRAWKKRMDAYKKRLEAEKSVADVEQIDKGE